MSIKQTKKYLGKENPNRLEEYCKKNEIEY